MAKLTKRTVDTLLRGARGSGNTPRRTVYCADVRGFGLRLSGSGRGVYVLKYVFHGRQRFLTLGEHCETFAPEQARAKALNALGKVRQGIDPIEDERAKARAAAAEASAGVTFAEIAAAYLSNGLGSLAESTREDRRGMLRAATETASGGHLVQRFGAMKARDIGWRELIDWWRAEVESGAIAQKTGSNRLDALSAVFGYAVDVELLESNPVDAVRPALRRRSRRTKSDRAQRDPSRNIRPLETAEELDALLEASASRPWIREGDRRADRDPDGPLLTLLLLDAGLRVGEAVALRWADITWGRDSSDTTRALEIRKARARGRHEGTTKSGRARSVALSRRLRAALLERYIAAGRPALDALVLPDADPSNYRTRHFGRACEAAQLFGLKPKDLRDTFGSQLLSSGVQLGYISRQLGHSSVAVTAMHYARWCGGDLYRAPLMLGPGEVPADLLARLPKTTGALAAEDFESAAARGGGAWGGIEVVGR